ncbi:MAG: acyltransferase family protein [Rudaea sp.]
MQRSARRDSTGRRYDFDWLRAIGAVLVVTAHTASTFSPWTAAAANYDPTFSHIETNKLFSEYLWILNLWLMPLFMLLGGASAWFTLGKRTSGRYLRERMVHIGLPFIFLMVALALPSSYAAQTFTGGFRGSFLDFVPTFFDGIYPNGHFALFHLWFLLYLLIYAIITLPLFRFLERPAGRRLVDRVARVSRRPGGIFVFVLPLLAVQLGLSGIWPQPQFPALVNDWKSFVMLLLAFIFGYILISDPRFQMAIARQWPLAAGVALATSAVLISIAWPDNFNPYRDLPVALSWNYLWFWTVLTISSWSWLVTLLGCAQRFLSRSHSLLKHAAEASYPLYLLHPLVWMPGILLIARLDVAAIPGFTAFTTGVLSGTYLLILLLKRWRVTRFLLGLKPGPIRSTSSTEGRRAPASSLDALQPKLPYNAFQK